MVVIQTGPLHRGFHINDHNPVNPPALASRRTGLGNHPALIVVDVIRGFTETACPLGSDADAVVAANCTLIHAFHAAGLPVVLTTVVYRNASAAKVFREKLPALDVLTPEGQWIDIDPRLPRDDKELILEKTHASAFHGTGLDITLRSLGIDSVVVTGLTTSGCVRATAVDALQYDFRTVVPREAVGDRDPVAHDANLRDLDRKYADVLSLAATLDLLAGVLGQRR